MSRDLHADFEAALTDGLVRPLNLVKFEFDAADGGTVRWHDDVGEIVWGNETYTGLGNIANVSDTNETTKANSESMKLTLSGFATNNGDLKAIAEKGKYFERPAFVYLAFRDTVRGTLIGEPTEIFAGYLDKMPVSKSRDTATVEANIESILVEWDRSCDMFLSHLNQIKQFPGDNGLIATHLQRGQSLKWGFNT